MVKGYQQSMAANAQTTVVPIGGTNLRNEPIFARKASKRKQMRAPKTKPSKASPKPFHLDPPRRKTQHVGRQTASQTLYNVTDVWRGPGMRRTAFILCAIGVPALFGQTPAPQGAA